MEKLKECVQALKDVRSNMQNDVDPCILAAVDEAIAKFERCETEDINQPSVAQATLTALAVISDIVTCLTGVAELVKLLGA